MDYIDTSQLFKCETCYHNLNGVCNSFCDSGESYRPAMSKLKVVDTNEVAKCSDVAENIRIEAIKEFAKRLKKYLIKPEYPWDDFFVCENTIDWLADEMTKK